QGVQGEAPIIDDEHCGATAKHYLGHGSPESGINIAPVSVGPREVRQLFVRPFESARKEAGVLSVMPAYHEIDGIPVACSRQYLTDLLRAELGFEGYTYSDWGAVEMIHNHHRVAGSLQEAGRMALEAGMDMDSPTQCYGRKLLDLVGQGRVSADLIDTAVRRILGVKLLLGVFERPYADIAKARRVRNCPEHRELALRAARESIVLLKNEGGLLRLKDSIRSIAVIGPNADAVQLGDYSGWNESLVSPLAGIRNRVAEGVEIRHARGCGIWERDKDGFGAAVAAAAGCDVAVVVVGESTEICSEGTDTNDLELPGVQLDLVKAVCETGTPVVVVLLNGRPLAIPWIAEHADAVLEVWFAGEEQGNAIADVIFGHINPSGKLPVSLPRSTGHVPCFYNKKPSALGYYKQPGSPEKPGRDYVFSSHTPLYEFGFGLSYTQFAYGDLVVTPERVGPDGEVSVSVQVENAGSRRGTEVVQLYLNDVYSSAETPVKELKRFERVWLDPGERRVVHFTLGPADLALVGRDMKWMVEPGDFEVLVGGLSALLYGCWVVPTYCLIEGLCDGRTQNTTQSLLRPGRCHGHYGRPSREDRRCYTSSGSLRRSLRLWSRTG
ncbi:MAG: glycoside hydrolase family 3 C-terminal domain-containing protein, partial [Actinobacteria bacterium]|nr:glycoside hydrolase family 3 C-terminal domain-containing protein [Actinomycetota bacterium]